MTPRAQHSVIVHKRPETSPSENGGHVDRRRDANANECTPRQVVRLPDLECRGLLDRSSYMRSAKPSVLARAAGGLLGATVDPSAICGMRDGACAAVGWWATLRCRASCGISAAAEHSRHPRWLHAERLDIGGPALRDHRHLHQLGLVPRRERARPPDALDEPQRARDDRRRHVH